VPISEADLAAAMLAGRRGDQAAYSHALSEIARLVRARVRRRLGWAANDLEDVVQEVLISVHLKRATWDEARPVSPWVNAIADHKAIDAIRRREREGRLIAASVTVEAIAELIPAPAPERDQVGLDLDRHVAALPTREQEVVRGLTVHGRTVRELASSLGMKEATVRVALHRGLKRLALAARRERS